MRCRRARKLVHVQLFQPPRFPTSRNLDKPLVGSDCLPVLAKANRTIQRPQVDGDKIRRNIPKIGNRVKYWGKSGRIENETSLTVCHIPWLQCSLATIEMPRIRKR